MPEVLIPAARHEPTDIGEGFIWGAFAAGVSVLVLCALIVLWLYPQSPLDRTLTLPLPVFPAPRLQPSPAADLKKSRAEELHVLQGTGWVDKAGSIVHIPISQAMRLVAQEGIPGWPVGVSPNSRVITP
jgi:hypothetical protein